MRRIIWQQGLTRNPRELVADFEGWGEQWSAYIRPCAGTGGELRTSCRGIAPEEGLTVRFPEYHEGHGATLERCKRVAREWARAHYMDPMP